MKKFIFYFILVFTLTTISNAEIVKTINVTGNDRIADETIIVFGAIIKNENYDAKELNDVLRNLYQTDFFSDVKLNLKNNVLNIIVSENPIIQNIVFNGLKAKKFKDVIYEIIVLKEKTSFTTNKFNQDINNIKNAFRNSGYYFVEVEAYKKVLANNSMDLIYEIDLGEKAKIAKIEFIGDKIYKDSKLGNIILSEETRPWKFISRRKFLDERRISSDQRLLEVFYKNNGYYDVKINTTNVNYLENEGFVLTFNINAGTRYKFSDLSINLSDDYTKDDFLEIEKKLSKLKNKYYSLNKIKKILDKINKLSEIKDYQFLTSELVETTDGDKISIDINIGQSEKYFVERVNIVGNSITNDNVIRGEMLVDEGDAYNSLILNKSLNNLRSRNIFASVKETTKQGSTPDLKVIEIEIEEKATGEIAIGAGIGTSGGTLGFNLSENNFMGKGIVLDTKLNITTDKITGRFSIRNPNYNYSGNAVTASIESTSVDRSQEFGYQTDKAGIFLSTFFEQYEDIYLAPEISVNYESLQTDDKASSAMKKQAGTFFDTYLSYSIIRDKRDQKFNTTEGNRLLFTQSLPVYSSSPNIVNGLDYSTYYPLKASIIASIKFYSRAINSLSASDDVRLSKRLHIPERRLRGFERGKIGPTDSGDYIGGNYASAISFNTAFPKLFSGLQNADFSLFLDAGNVWGVDYDKKLDGANKIRSAFGLSATWHTMMGPLSFSLSQDLSKTSTDVPESFRFNLGTTF